jgi:hypothetical protein
MLLCSGRFRHRACSSLSPLCSCIGMSLLNSPDVSRCFTHNEQQQQSTMLASWPPPLVGTVQTMAVSDVNSSRINRSATVINVHRVPEVPLNPKPSQLLLSGRAAPHLPLRPAAWLQTAATRPTAYLPPTFAA